MSARDYFMKEKKLEEGSGADSDDDDDSAGVHSDQDEEEVEVPAIDLEEDIFGITICALMRDFHFISLHKGSAISRYARLLMTVSLLFGCLGTQVYLLGEFKRFVTAKAVHDIRGAYDLFERKMYDDTIKTPFGNHRGIGKFEHGRFAGLAEEEKASVCRIPLSQPEFFAVILVIWSLTCFQQLKRCKEDFQSLVWNTKHCESMRDSQLDIDGDQGEVIQITHLTYGVKAFITGFVLIPRVLITCYLLWIGCRWLLATNNFADLILNAVALEFVLLLKDSLYVSLVSDRSRRDLGNTKINPPSHKEKAGIWVFTGTIVWMFVAVAWVFAYMGIPHHTEGFQEVLPEYRWDVQAVCSKWIAWRYCVSADCPPEPTGHVET